jgi:hypothetical protein
LLLGVDNGGSPVGLEADYASIRKPGKNDRDLFQLHLVNVLNRSGAGTTRAPFLGKRSRKSLTYRVLAARRVREQLEGAPPELRGYVDGVVAFLRADPAAASVAFILVGGSDYKTIVFGEGRGFLDDHVFEEQRVVVLVDLIWL